MEQDELEILRAQADAANYLDLIVNQQRKELEALKLRAGKMEDALVEVIEFCNTNAHSVTDTSPAWMQYLDKVRELAKEGLQ